MSQTRVSRALGAVAGLLLAWTLVFCTSAAARQACPATPPAVHEVRSANIYGEGRDLRRGVDAGSAAERELLIKPVSDFMQTLALLADEAIAKNSDDAGRCAIVSLRVWASQNAMLGETGSEAASKELIWNTAGIALAYLRVRRLATAAEANEIDGWVAELAQRIVGRYGRSKRHDNVYCWSGLVAAAAASVSGSEALWSEAVRIHEEALREVDAKGALPNEVGRGQRALAYHNFALVPIVVIDVLRERAGRSSSQTARDAMTRLTRFTHAAMNNPAELASMAGSPQAVPNKRHYSVWTHIASDRIPGFHIDLGRTKVPPFERWIGGGATYFR